MTESKLSMAEREANDVTILMLTGEMLIDDGDLAYGRRIDELVARGRLKLLVDLAGVTHIDSSGVGMMAAVLKSVRARGGDVRLLHVSRKGQRLLSVLRLKTLFEAFDDEDLALRSFQWRPSGG
jgi:anti-sigma B factor antagonist